MSSDLNGEDVTMVDANDPSLSGQGRQLNAANDVAIALGETPLHFWSETDRRSSILSKIEFPTEGNQEEDKMVFETQAPQQRTLSEPKPLPKEIITKVAGIFQRFRHTGAETAGEEATRKSKENSSRTDEGRGWDFCSILGDERGRTGEHSQPKGKSADRDRDELINDLVVSDMGLNDQGS
ncbi:hypothetical protein AJ78_06231 [Emergomyces pasteurianus Ep9510]|uniref:Uncharacterized protein n=1 Tax=Emergomyces pasteurianus Ep9510 TaxID=1447872 RepID=A0A1J9PZJ1_9EURO|nr:hypothetical protein AJ78_06231 [Emergomyces pasteurianus Ep9510]